MVSDPPNGHTSAEGLKCAPILDDIVQCGFSEATGKIVLGTRDNRMILL